MVRLFELWVLGQAYEHIQLTTAPSASRADGHKFLLIDINKGIYSGVDALFFTALSEVELLHHKTLNALSYL